MDNYRPTFVNDIPSGMNGKHHYCIFKVSRCFATKTANEPIRRLIQTERVAIWAYGRTQDEAYQLASDRADQFLAAELPGQIGKATLDEVEAS